MRRRILVGGGGLCLESITNAKSAGVAGHILHKYLGSKAFDLRRREACGESISKQLT